MGSTTLDQVFVRAKVIAAVAAGGVFGALGRHGLEVLFGQQPGVTFAVNVVGCLLIGALTVLIGAGHRLLRSFLGTGLLGGFTTFSGYTVDIQRLLAAGRVVAAAGYLAGTLAAAVLAVQLGVVLGRAAARGRRRA